MNAATNTAAALREVDGLLEAVWTALVSGTLRIDELMLMSPHAAALYLAGFDAGIAASVERVWQAERSADRYYLAAFNPAERSTVIQARLDAAIEAMPDDVLEHSPDYFEHVLNGTFAGGAA